MGGEILSPINRRGVGQPNGLIGHVENFIGGFVGQHQTTFQDGGCTGAGNGCVDRQRSGVVEGRIFREVDKTIIDDTVM